MLASSNPHPMLASSNLLLCLAPTATDPAASTPKWFMPHVDRSTAETVLRNAPNGTFLIRPSAVEDARYCLSYVFNNEVYHMLVDEDHQGASFREAPEAFNSVDDLIEYHQRLDQSALFCPLAGVASVPGSTRDLPTLPLTTATLPLTTATESRSRALPTATEPITVPAQPKPTGFQPAAAAAVDDYWLMLDPTSKAEALASLEGRPEGAFVVRSSERFYECTVLSYIHGNQVGQTGDLSSFERLDPNNAVWLQILHELIGVDVNEDDEMIGVHLVKDGDVIFPDHRAMVVCSSCSTPLVVPCLRLPYPTPH